MFKFVCLLLILSALLTWMALPYHQALASRNDLNDYRGYCDPCLPAWYDVVLPSLLLSETRKFKENFSASLQAGLAEILVKCGLALGVSVLVTAIVIKLRNHITWL